MIDKSKTYRTCDGREVRIYATDGLGSHPVHGAVKNPDGWRQATWMANGYWASVDTGSDLIEVKPRIKREVWVNAYPDERLGQVFKTKEEADHYSAPHRIACVKLTIDCEEGEGL